MYFETSNDISNIKWYPIISYSIPVSDDVQEPYAVFDDRYIHIYLGICSEFRGYKKNTVSG